VSGFIVETEEEAVQAVKRLATLDRREVRRAFERRFTALRNAKIISGTIGNYLDLLPCNRDRRWS